MKLCKILLEILKATLSSLPACFQVFRNPLHNNNNVQYLFDERGFLKEVVPLIFLYIDVIFDLTK